MVFIRRVSFREGRETTGTDRVAFRKKKKWIGSCRNGIIFVAVFSYKGRFCPKKSGTTNKESFGMETWYYEVVSIDGDYANLKRTDIESEDLKLVARALLPAEIVEGSQLKYEFMQYSLVQ